MEGNGIFSKKAYLVIRQTLSTVKITCISEESASKLVSGTIYKEDTSDIINGTYLNRPDQRYRHRSQLHYGTLHLTIQKNKTPKGFYWTDRKTTGDLFFSKISKKIIAENFDELDKSIK